MTETRPTRRAAMLLIVTDDGLLLHHRDDKPGIAHPDCWAGFGGAVEEGETVTEAVLREVREETGLVIEDPVFLTEATDHEGDGRLAQTALAASTWSWFLGEAEIGKKRSGSTDWQAAASRQCLPPPRRAIKKE